MLLQPRAPYVHGLLLMVMATTAALDASGQEQLEPAPTRPTATEQAIIDAINRERQKAGVSKLRVNHRLMQAGAIHAKNMERHKQGGHVLEKVKPQWRTPEARLEQVGYRGWTWGENVFWGSEQADAIVGAWMKSEGHRANLLNPRFNEVGVGQAGRRFASYVCAVLGASELQELDAPATGRAGSNDATAMRRGRTGQPPDGTDVSWRYRWHNGRWWYWLPSERWAVWSNGRWVAPAEPGQSNHRKSKTSGPAR